VEYTYAIDKHCYEVVTATKTRLEKQGARLNNIAERVYFDMPAVHRGARMATRDDIHIIAGVQSLGDRVGW
jgi:hypothetical protein